MTNPRKNQLHSTILTAACGLSVFSCTGQIPNSFRLAQQEQNFNAQLDINTKIDLLWVVDNSSSMNAAQNKLRQGFAGFAQKYMQPTWDIQVAVITTDAFLANPAFQNYLNSTIPLTTGWTSPYVQGRLGTFQNPSSNPTLVNLGTGAFDNGVKIKDLVPSWGADYAKLLPGMHDGPVAGFCFEGLPYIFNAGLTAECSKRDDQTNVGYQDASHCLSPNAGSGETSDNMCINTIENDTVRSHKAILKTMPGSPLSGAALTAWTNQLIDDFKVNASVGVTGMGSERGLGSLLQVIADNEVAGSPSKFFRPGSLRGIIFVSDEDDQSMEIASGSQISPWDGYMCDQAGLVSMNPSGNITGNNGYCCSNPANHCTYGSEGTSCPAKVIDGTSLTVSLCANPSKLIPVASVKAQLDSFFSALDQNPGNPNYFISTITPLSMSSITDLQGKHDTDDSNAGAFINKAADRGDRYLALGDLVGNGSLSMDINSADYSPLLDQIGQAIILKKSTFPLSRIPTGEEDMIITLIHADGSSMIIPEASYVISGASVIITDQDLVLSFTAGDQLVVNYQPKFVNQ